MSPTISRVLGMMAALGLSAGQAQAFGGAYIDLTQQVLAGHEGSDNNCDFLIYHEAPGGSGGYPESAEVSIFPAFPEPTSYPSGSFWDRGNIATGNSITAALLESHCNLTNVTNLVGTGADPGETYASQAFIGLEFRATFGGDGNTYDYRIGLSGATSTVLVNTRTLFLPPDTTPPTAMSLVRLSPSDTITSADTLTWRLTFDEDVKNVDAGDFIQTGTTATLGVTGSGAVYDLTLSGGDLANLTGAVSIGFAVGQNIADLADNAFAAGAPATNQPNYSLDNASDSVLIGGPSGNVSGEFEVTVTFMPNGASAAPNSANPGTAPILAALQITNATQTGATSFAGNTLTFHLTPVGAGAITVSLPAAAANDGVGNPTLPSNTLNVTAADTEDPVVTVPADINVNTDPGQATAVVTFAAPTATDNVAVTAGPTLTAGLASGATFPLGATVVTYEAEDAAGNTGSASFTVTVTDAEDPVVTVPSNISVNTDAGQATAVVTYAAASATDNVGVASGPAVSAGLASGSAFPLGTTTVTYQASDTAGNTGSASFTVTVTDGEDPVVTVPANIVVGTDAGQTTAAVTYTLPTVADNVGVISGPTLSAGPASGGTFPLGVTTVTYTAADAAGNTGSANFTVTVQDDEDPVVTVPANIAVAAATGQMSAVVNYATPTATDNVGVTSGPVRTVGQDSGTAFSLGVTVVTFAASDAAGNTGTASFTVTVTDEEDPVVTVPSNITVSTDPGLATAVVNYAVPTATDNAGVVSGPTLVAGLASGSAFPAGVTTVTFEAEDGDGNVGSASFTVTVTDGQDPVVTVPADIVVGTDPGVATAVVTYAAPTATDNVAVTSGPSLTAGLASGATFPLGTTTVTFAATDGDNNTGSASFTVTVEDREAPVIRPVDDGTFEAPPSGLRTVGISTIVDDNVDTGIAPVFSLDGNIITSPYAFPVGTNVIKINATDTAGNPAVEEEFTFTITPGEAPDAPVITTSVINANRSMTIGGTAEVDSIVSVTFPDTRSEVVTATGGTFSVTSAEDMTGGTISVTAKDEQGYISAAATVELFPDYDGPTVTIAGGPGKIEDLTPFNVTITFSETVTGFDQSDVTLTGGTISGFTDANPVFTVEVTPNLAQNVAVSVAAEVAEDDFSNLNAASNVLSIANATMTETEELVVEAAQARNAALIRNRPRISRFLLGGFSGQFNAGVTQGAGNFDFGTSSDRPVWVAARGQWSKLDSAETSYANVQLGGHYAPSKNLLLGVMGIFDNAVTDDGDARMESTGWLIGPYAVARTPHQPLVFSASYLVGRSDNTASPQGTYEDDYESDRMLATLGVAGEVELTRLTLIPLLDLAYAEEENEAYVGGDSVAVRSMKVTTTEATLGLDFIMPLHVENGSFDLIGGIGATASVADDGFNEDETTRGQTELGFRYGMVNGGLLTARASYDGLGDADYEAFGAEVIFEIEF